MPTAPQRSGDQTYDGLLVRADLPEGWYLPSRFPGERDDDASEQIDALLGYNDQVRTEEQGVGQLDSDQNETIDGRWRYLEHNATATRVHIRLQRQLYATPEEIRITGVIYLPWRPGDPITSQLLRELPTARIEAANLMIEVRIPLVWSVAPPLIVLITPFGKTSIERFLSRVNDCRSRASSLK